MNNNQIGEQYVQDMQQQAVITRHNLQRSLMRLDVRQRLELKKREYGTLRKTLNVYADKVDLVNISDLTSLRAAMSATGFVGIKKVSIVFRRYGIFVENGAPPKTRKGKGIKITPRKPFPWLSVILPKEVEAFEKIVVNQYGGFIANELRFLIPGILDSRAGENKNKFLL